MKVVEIKTLAELVKFSKFNYEEDSYARDRCKNCGTINFPLCSICQKYKEWECTRCGHKNEMPYLFPDAARVIFCGATFMVLYRN